MFQQYAGYFWAALFAALIFYSLWRSLGAPYCVRRFYREAGFIDHGKSAFDRAAENSLLLQDLEINSVYAGKYRDYSAEQFCVHRQTSGRSMFGRATRKRNQPLWTITILRCEKLVVPFCARPARARDAVEYLVNLDNVIFPDDEAFSRKVHILSGNHDDVRAAFSPLVRDHLTNIDPVSLESTEDVLILKSPRQPHDTGGKLKAELDALIAIYESVVESSVSTNVSTNVSTTAPTSISTTVSGR